MTLQQRIALIDLEARFQLLRARKVLNAVYYRIPAFARPKPKVLSGHLTTAAVFALAKFGVHLSPAEAGYASVAAGATVAWFVRDEKKPEPADDAESPTAAVRDGVADEGPIQAEEPPMKKPRPRRRASRTKRP